MSLPNEREQEQKLQEHRNTKHHRSDISLPNEREQEQKLQEDLSSFENPKSTTTSSKKAGFVAW